MAITYKEIDTELLENITVKYGEWAKKHIHIGSDSFSLAAIFDDIPVGFISTYIRNLDEPLAEEKDAYIDVIEVDKEFRRKGIAAELISRTEVWAKEEGLLQIRAWSNQSKVGAIKMWRSLGYGLCPAKIWIEWCHEIVDGYYVVKQLNPKNPYPEITKLIKKDLRSATSKPIGDFRLTRAKSGVYVYKCLYDGSPAVVKYFENESDRREILNYRILTRHNIPTIDVLALGTATLVMEDISASDDWRLGVEDDFYDVDVTKCLAKWYFTFHENGTSVSELESLFFEYDSLTKENFIILKEKFPEARELFDFVLAHYDKLRKLLYKPAFTLAYNDFHWSNFVVRKDKTSAMMIDFNLMGKGYRYSDFQNVCGSLSEEAKSAFIHEYERLYKEKHGHSRSNDELTEKQIANVAGKLYELVVAFLERDTFPEWAEAVRNEAQDGSLLAETKKLLSE